MKALLGASIVLLMLAFAAGEASSASPAMEAVSLDTSITLSLNGDGHVVQHIVVTDVSATPIAVGLICIRLPENAAFPGNVMGSRHNYTNITVQKQDGSPVEYNVSQDGNSLVLDIFCMDQLMEGWNTHFILAYDVGSMATNGILASQVAYASGVEGMSVNDSHVALNIPPGTRVTYTSAGASIDGKRIDWQDKDALSIYAEYTSLPIPGLPMPLQYGAWGGLALLSLIWCFKPRK
jgi:hypothetical protein